MILSVLIIITAFLLTSLIIASLTIKDCDGVPFGLTLFFVLGLVLSFTICHTSWQQWCLGLNLAKYNQRSGQIEYVTKENILVSLQQTEEQRVEESPDNSSLEQTVLDCE